MNKALALAKAKVDVENALREYRDATKKLHEAKRSMNHQTWLESRYIDDENEMRGQIIDSMLGAGATLKIAAAMVGRSGPTAKKIHRNYLTKQRKRINEQRDEMSGALELMFATNGAECLALGSILEVTP